MTFDFAALQVDDGGFQDAFCIFAAGIDCQRAPDAHVPGRFVDMAVQGEQGLHFFVLLLF